MVQVMQNVSNLQEEMEAKEAFMHPLNFIMPASVVRVKSFIEELVQIDQKEGIYMYTVSAVNVLHRMYM